ncbi:hypothetical protein ACFFF5_08755 [Lederbergia wuyishanensis]|uniref:Uncharacterized protein n=1 Tax=Lederbergia wuyishanensis TaxID=1347903 RepID=A0ABU0D669_9BACI|nr:hypothetical protein [Lederbergia wuyishanensis]MCJ8008692.1 hypothetical protein [Lederbergia wuyishanensis]MDQ0343889.1 hypothetical protein [Lederbergia wuyishanensis]
MNGKLINIKEKMNKTVLRDIYFSDELEQKVLFSIKNSMHKQDVSPFKNRFISLLSLTVAAVFFIGISLFVGTQLHLFKGDQESNARIIETEKNGTVVNPSEEISNNETSLPPFELTSDEEKAYNNFQSNLDLTYLKGLGPISIAKLYIKAGFDKKYNVQYALYTDRPDYIQWSKEEDEKIPESHRGTNEQNFERYKNIDKGNFVQTSDYEGYIEYDSNDNSEIKSGFKMVKDENGVWRVAFMPTQ